MDNFIVVDKTERSKSKANVGISVPECAYNKLKAMSTQTGNTMSDLFIQMVDFCTERLLVVEG